MSIVADAAKVISDVNPDLLESMLDSGLDANESYGGSLLSHALRVYLDPVYDPDTLACQPRKPEALRQIAILLEHNADVNAPIVFGNRPLHFAVAYDAHRPRLDEALFHLLLEHGADVSLENSRGHTPLKVADTRFRDSLAQIFQQHVSLPVQPRRCGQKISP